MPASYQHASARSEATGSLWDASIRWEIDESQSRNPQPRINWWRALLEKKNAPYSSGPDWPIYTPDEPGLLVVRIYGDGPYDVLIDSPEVTGGASGVRIEGSPWESYAAQRYVPCIRSTYAETVPMERIEWRGETSRTTQAKPDGAVTVLYSTDMRGADGTATDVREMEPGVWVADRPTYGTMLVRYGRRVHELRIEYEYFPQGWGSGLIEGAIKDMIDGDIVNYTSPRPELCRSVPLWYKIDYTQLNRHPLVILVRDELRPHIQDIITADRWREHKASAQRSIRRIDDEPEQQSGAATLPSLLTEVSRETTVDIQDTDCGSIRYVRVTKMTFEYADEINPNNKKQIVMEFVA